MTGTTIAGDRAGDALPGVDEATTEQVVELRQGMRGRWQVATRSSTHIWDLDAMTYTRRPGPGAGAMQHDNEAVAIDRVEAWPSVGRKSLLFFDDPDDPAIEHWRISSRIESIVRLASPRRDEENGLAGNGHVEPVATD